MMPLAGEVDAKTSLVFEENMSMDSSSGDFSLSGEEGTSSPVLQQEWIVVQDVLKQKLILEDDFTWAISPRDAHVNPVGMVEMLHYIGGVDVSFLKEDPSLACGALVVLDACTMNVVHEEFEVVRLQVPYVPGFLAFREVPILLKLLERMKSNAHSLYPQLLMVDGNGILHPRGFGVACHLGVLANLPTIGIGKNLHHVDGITQSRVRQLLESRPNIEKDIISLVGESGKVWGAAMRSTSGSVKPIYISLGHRISLESSIRVTKFCCKFRVPEPIRQADIRSRVFLQKLKISGNLAIGTATSCSSKEVIRNIYRFRVASKKTHHTAFFPIALIISPSSFVHEPPAAAAASSPCINL
ncbi:deoxyribonuclease V [Apostasia shenzhenica]|uniref:Deoxyribonuclease V n=1 Tax=Apostasia shenzhenica TaxID=1088818 RepID=A0A2I0A546_9ASPA|nr:deoxyribonuclease V [Apostasia shenzhenica]